MELKLKIYTKNTFPKRGILIKSASAEVWLDEIQNMGLLLDTIKVFPVPGTRANELFGCLIFLKQNKSKINDIGKNNFYQLAENKLFIPENTIVSPELSEEEWHRLFSEDYYFLHPEIGLVELKDEVNWLDLIQLSGPKKIEITEPSKTVSIPQYITSMRIEVDEEKILDEIENPISEEERIAKLPFDLQKVMQGNQKEMDKFLKFLDENPKMALQLGVPLDTLGTSRGDNSGKFSFRSVNGSYNCNNGFGLSATAKESFSKVFKFGFIILFVILIKSYNPDHEPLEFQSLFKGLFGFIIIALFVGLVVSLLSRKSSNENASKSGGSFLVDSERFTSLQNRYEKLAEEYADNKEYAKAAHIYLKLLKNHHKAAEALEKGELYTEAAAIYLKYHKNKEKAAQCYEKGHAYRQAIELYKELDEFEKVGDLYIILNNKAEAEKYFHKVILNYCTNFQYVKASLIYKNKIGDIAEAQDLLMRGWRMNKDAGKCLNSYFANIKSAKELSTAIQNVYKDEATVSNMSVFLHLLKHEYTKYEVLEEEIRNIAYEIAAERIDKDTEIASELIHFNKSNKSMLKDVMKYKLKRKRL